MPNEKKYTMDFIIEESRSILDQIRNDSKIAVFLKVFENRDYTKERYYEWKRACEGLIEDEQVKIHKYAKPYELTEENKEIAQEFVDNHSKIKEILEGRVVDNALAREYDRHFAEFVLKQNYDWDETPGEEERVIVIDDREDEQEESEKS